MDKKVKKIKLIVKMVYQFIISILDLWQLCQHV